MQRRDGPVKRDGMMKYLSLLGVICVFLGTTACFFMKKEQPWVPLALESGVTPQVATLTEQGTQAYQAKQFDDAKNYFSQAVTAVPQSGPAHYNYALALYALGDTEQARQQFMEAANLAPGDKVIWDSPALRPYGNVESPKKKLLIPPTGTRQGLGGGAGGPR
ncbi:MAG TPA: tetratricopeptide repeat protein [Nitrospiraceae bacterium]|nr:tetratricopeptide repeat protein [Nitrospiraceae bacterium]